jgi:hypothetical protein
MTRQCGFSIVVRGGLDDRITVAFDALPVAQALKRILRGRSFVLRYTRQVPGEGDRGDRQTNALWVFSGDSADERITHLHPVRRCGSLRGTTEPEHANLLV